LPPRRCGIWIRESGFSIWNLDGHQHHQLFSMNLADCSS
jgi:hypothetical protein